MGKSNVLPFEVMFRTVPEVEAKVWALAPAVSVMPVEIVQSPKIVLARLLSVPAKPVKLRLRTFPASRVSEYVPAVKLKLIELASVGEPGDTVMALEVLFVTLTTGVPVTVKFVAVATFHTMFVLVLVTDMLLEPKARVRALLLLLLNKPVDKVNPLKSSVPAVSVVVRVGPTVRLSSRRNVPPKPLNVTGKSKVLPFEVIVRAVAFVDANVSVLVVAGSVMPVEIVRLPKIDWLPTVQDPAKPVKLRLRTATALLRLSV